MEKNVSNSFEENLERMAGRLVNAILIAVLAIGGTVIGGTIYLTRMDSRIASIERDLPRLTSSIDRLVDTLPTNMLMRHEIDSMLTEQQRLQLQIDRVECRMLGDEPCP